MEPTPLTNAELARIREAFRNVPYARMLGIEIESVERGTATLTLHVRDELKQNRGVVHGGVTASLIDTASAFAIISLLEENQSATTIDLTLHYLRPLTEGKITARAHVLRHGKRLLVVSVDTYDADEKLAITAITTYLRLS